MLHSFTTLEREFATIWLSAVCSQIIAIWKLNRYIYIRGRIEGYIDLESDKQNKTFVISILYATNCKCLIHWNLYYDFNLI